MTTVEIRDKSLTRVGVLSEQDLTGVTFTPEHNAVGTFTVVLPEVVDGVAHEGVVLLRDPGAGVVITLDDGTVFSGMVEDTQCVHSIEHPEGQWTFTGRSDLRVLADEVAYPPGTLSAPTAAYDTQTGPRETLLHHFVSANAGTREGVTGGADSGAGDSITKSARFDNLLTLCQDIASDQVCFDVVQDGDVLQFVTWTPTDHSLDVQLDYANGSLSSMTSKFTAPSYTRVIALGSGDGTARKVLEVTNDATSSMEAIFGRRVKVLDYTNSDDDSELTKSALDDLTNAAATTSCEAVPSDDVALGNAKPGDWVTVVDGTDAYKVQLATVPHSFTNGAITGATIGTPITGDSAIISKLSSKILSLVTRVNALERSR